MSYDGMTEDLPAEGAAPIDSAIDRQAIAAGAVTILVNALLYLALSW